MKVTTTLKVGYTANANTAPASQSDTGVLDVLQNAAGHAKTFVTSPTVRGVARELVWWPFGPPSFLRR